MWKELQALHHVIMDGDYNILVYCMLTFILLYMMYCLVSSVDRMIVMLLHRIKREGFRDAARVYKKGTRRHGSRDCNHRCEGTGIVFRCTHVGNDLHADHWYPHARGGATTKKNLVMLCPAGNKHKSAKVPTVFQTYALYFRRRFKYGYPKTFEAIKPGEWL